MSCWGFMCSVHCRKTTTGPKARTHVTPASAFLSAPSHERATRWPGSAPAREGSSAGSAIAVTTTLLRSPHLDAKVWLFQKFLKKESVGGNGTTSNQEKGLNNAERSKPFWRKRKIPLPVEWVDNRECSTFLIDYREQKEKEPKTNKKKLSVAVVSFEKANITAIFTLIVATDVRSCWFPPRIHLLELFICICGKGQ